MPDNRKQQSNAAPGTAKPPSPDTLQDSMSRLKIHDNHKGGDAAANPYPDRPSESDCTFYMRTGSCGYGSNCRYNHPTHIGQGNQYRSELPERVGQPDCQYFMKTGTCKFGSTCKYHHPRDRHDVQPVPLNLLGLPMRQDEKSCPYYMRTGSCKFGIVCKFNHPQPATAAFPMAGPSAYGSPGSSMAPPSGLPLIGGFSAWPLSRPPYMSSARMQGVPAYMPIVLPPSQGTMPVHHGWSTYTGSVGHGPSTDLLGTTTSNLKNLVQTGSSTLLNLPERPDQLECQYYMKTGSCKYGTTCKYHHPKERNSPATYTLGPHGFPLRPGQAVCTFYSMYASCNYGSECRFDHPLVRYYNYSMPALSTPDPLSLIANQRNSHARWASGETSPSKTQRSLDLLGKSDEPQSSGNKEHAKPAQTISPSYTAPSPDHSD